MLVKQVLSVVGRILVLKIPCRNAQDSEYDEILYLVLTKGLCGCN